MITPEQTNFVGLFIINKNDKNKNFKVYILVSIYYDHPIELRVNISGVSHAAVYSGCGYSSSKNSVDTL